MALAVIDLLARHPSTARVHLHQARAPLRDRRSAAGAGRPRGRARFRETDGDIRAVLVTIFTSPEFVSADTYRAKTKTPLEVVASAVRALDGRLDPPPPAAAPPGAGRRRRPRAGPPGRRAGRAALRGGSRPPGYADVAAGVGEHGGAAGPHELRARPRPGPACAASAWISPRLARRRGPGEAGGGARSDARRRAARARRRPKTRQVLGAQLGQPRDRAAQPPTTAAPRTPTSRSWPRSCWARPSSRGDSMHACTRRAFMKGGALGLVGIGLAGVPALPRPRGARAGRARRGRRC